MKRDKRACPNCAETVKGAARKCKRCGFEFLPAAVPAMPHEKTARLANFSTAAVPTEPVRIHTFDVSDALAALVEKSLVARDEATGRFRLLETVRQYANDCLVEIAEGEKDAWCVRHRDYFVVLAEEAYEKRFTGEAPALLHSVEREHDNCRTAVDFCAAGSDSDVHLRLVGALAKFWEQRGYLREGRTRVANALSRPDAQGITAARARSLLGAANLAAVQNDPNAARLLFEQSAEIWRALGDKRSEAIVLNNLGVLERYELHYDNSQALLDKSLALMRELCDLAGTALVLDNIGNLARLADDPMRARPLLEESAALSRESGNLYVLEESLKYLAIIATVRGDYEAARAQFREHLALVTASRHEESLIEMPEAVAELAACMKRPHIGARLIGAAAAARERTGIPIRPYERVDHDRREQLLRAALGERTYAQEWTTGFKLTTEEALALAKEMLEEPE